MVDVEDGHSKPNMADGEVYGRMSAEQMDLQRTENVAYQYLCHLEEAKVWIQACINEQLPATTELEEGLRNGVALAKLGHFFSKQTVPFKKIYDPDQKKYEMRGLHFRHTDNINHWLKAMEEIKFPKIFYPETTDIYDRKNMPRTIYCIHALSLYLFKLGLAPQIQDLYGKIKFSDEEISAMRKELDKYGIQMPAFSKIGGILANEMPVDEAALHAAVIAINDAVEHDDVAGTIQALQNPAAHLVQIIPEYADDYQEIMYIAKNTKAENSGNKSIDPDVTFEPDVYDELLTQAEIQGNINKVNTLQALAILNEAVESNSPDLLSSSLRSHHLNLMKVNTQYAPQYLLQLRQIQKDKRNNNGAESGFLDKNDVQTAILTANMAGDSEQLKCDAIAKINVALESGDPMQTLQALQNPHAQLPQVFDFAAPLYQDEFFNIKSEKGNELEYAEILGGVKVLSAIGKINKAVDIRNPDEIIKALSYKHAHISNIDKTLQDKYLTHLAKTRQAKNDEGLGDLLTHFEIQEVVDVVNKQVEEESDCISAIEAINDAVERRRCNDTLKALEVPSAKLVGVQADNVSHYQALLAEAKQKKAKETNDANALLWLDEIQQTIHQANSNAQQGQKMSVAMAAINIAIDDGNVPNLLKQLLNVDAGLHSVTAECGKKYLKYLTREKAEKQKTGDCGSGWMMNRIREGHKFYFNCHNMEYSWERRPDCTKDFSLLNKEDIQAIISEATCAHDRQAAFLANEHYITLLQSRIRGFLARKDYAKRKDYMLRQVPAATKIQSWWRMILQRSLYKERLATLHNNPRYVVRIQSNVRMFLARKKYTSRQSYYKMHEDAIIKIQAFFRANKARADYRRLMSEPNPRLSVVRKFVHLLDSSDADYKEEIELQRLREEVVNLIKSNKTLEEDLDQMDIKIGLLVKNRITLQDVLSHDRKLKHFKENPNMLSGRGLKALSRESREKLDAYQHLFYLLQTNPTYLAKLIFEMPQSRTTKFMESVILTLYNYASSNREEYLLFKLFKTALQEEVKCKVDKMSDVVTGNPMVVKMIVGFNRNTRGQNALRELLNPLVQSVVDNRNLRINTNPVEIYKTWVNQMETQTGKACGMPYDVTLEQALTHAEVQKRLQESIYNLRVETDKFFNVILRSLDKIPYGMRYMAKVLRTALHEKFPTALEKDVLKIVGNLLYYRFINSAIVAPDAFDIIDVGAKQGLSNDQRRNLGSIAKILQFAASNKGFGGESAHLSCLNTYIKEAHEKFKNYFRSACNVEEPELVFNVDQYTDVANVTKPVIYISIQEICDTHQLLLDHQAAVATDPQDPIHELLDDLGDRPNIDDLIGECSCDEGGILNKQQMAKTEVSLTLSNKFEVPDGENSDQKALLIRTKQMVVDVIRHQTGDTLMDILRATATDEMEYDHQKLIRERERLALKARTRKAKLTRQQSVFSDLRLPLEGMKTKIIKNLQSLEIAGVISHKDDYQGLVNIIARDIRNQRFYRSRRRQETIQLKNTSKALTGKRAFYEEQVDYYNQYVKTCLTSLASKEKKKRSSLFHKEPSKKCIKYSGARLYEKGVVLEIEGLPTNQFKNVLFEIGEGVNAGVFEVNAKFLGVTMDEAELVFQDLLQLQYDGVAVMKMFGKAKINVNLLVFLLNKKFYSKTH
ncbi:unnamed protein product [Owenia fusiformis]|uniref:Ras GTPase-activating-like protein IQGAP1 n=1 Tax=Owenia fusiformis TaxID=6347 RepID=A0A8S4PVB7_OWEFU|nr:unnamed protein product [Owenia fusiformis]